MTRWIFNVCYGFAAGACLLAQAPGTETRFELPAPPVGTFGFIAAEPGLPGKMVTGAPYSAEAITEFTQVLGDGTRINRKSSSKTARDSQGRTREERTLGMIGPWAAEGDPPRIVTITDPVAREIYVLNEKEKTARKLKMPDGDVVRTFSSQAPGNTEERRVQRFERVIVARRAGPVVGTAVGTAEAVAGVPAMSDTLFFRRNSTDGKTESLGTQTMEGLLVEGTRVTHTIPTGEIGNDRPIVTTTERWISPDLQTTVSSISKDPQFGETNYRLLNVNRSEPPKSLFEIPPDYKVEESPRPIFMPPIPKQE